MAENIIVCVFRDYGVAHRAFYELLRAEIAPNNISIVAGERSNRQSTHRDFGILDDNFESYVSTVQEGKTLLVVRVAGADRARIEAIIDHYAPIAIEENQRRMAWSQHRGDNPQP